MIYEKQKAHQCLSFINVDISVSLIFLTYLFILYSSRLVYSNITVWA